MSDSSATGLNPETTEPRPITEQVPMAEMPPYQFNLPNPVRSPRLGRTAMIMAVCVLSLSLVASLLIGLFGTTVYLYHDVVTGASGSSAQAGFNANPNQLAAGVQFALGSIFGIWALVQGIVATVQNRGRRFGVVAIVLAGSAPILSLILWGILGALFGHRVSQ